MQGAWRVSCLGWDEAPNQPGQIEGAVDPVLHLDNEALAVLCEVELMVSPTNGGLGVAVKRIGPTERLKLEGLAVAQDDGGMHGNLAGTDVALAQPSVTRCALGCSARLAQAAKVSPV